MCRNKLDARLFRCFLFINRSREVLACKGFSNYQYPLPFIRQSRYLCPIVMPTLQSFFASSGMQAHCVPPPNVISSSLMVVLPKMTQRCLNSTMFWYNQAFNRIDIDNRYLLLVIKQYSLALMSHANAFT